MRGIRKNASLTDVLLNVEKFVHTDKLYGLHRAWCRSGHDPNLDDPKRRGRIKVYVPRMHPDNTPDEHLPWAEPCYQDGGGDNYGDLSVPAYGDTVWVMFEGGSRNHPVWMGTWWGMPKGQTEAVREGLKETKTQRVNGVQRYPRRRVWKTRYGHRIELGDDEGELEIVVSTRDGNKCVLRDSPSAIEDGEVRRSPGIRLEDYNGNYIHMDPEQKIFSIYFVGDKQETIVGNVTQHIKKAADGSGGNRMVVVEGSDITKNRSGVP